MRKLLTVAVMLSLAGLATADIIFDQIGPNPNAVTGKNVFASQDFEASFNQYDIGVLDNFTVQAPGYKLTDVEAVIGFWNGTANFANITGYRFEVYNSTAAAAANLTGNVATATVATYSNLVQPWGAAPNRQGKVLLNLVPANITLPAGNYYMAVIPQMTFSGIGQCGISGSTMGDLNASQANPGGGFAFPGNWQPISPADNAAYRLSGVAIPEPTSLALLALGSLVLIRRR